mmetsp:Transcript_11630/g.48381  ORF Transcript_11630/g.48381 Transcript_11630/m.48381 type:complete len:298 (-) Transcript_11630:60-953(-)
MEVECMPKRFLESVYKSDLDRKAALHKCFRSIAKASLEVVRDVVDEATSITDGDNLKNETVARNYLYLLQYLCKDRKSLNAHIPVLRVLQLLRNFKGDLEIVTRGSSCLVAGCTEEEPRAMALNHGCIEFVSTLFEDYSSDKKVLENCLALLANVCNGSKTAKSLAARTGCLRAVHDLVDSEDIGIAYSSCVVVRNLTASEVANSRTFIDLGMENNVNVSVDEKQTNVLESTGLDPSLRNLDCSNFRDCGKSFGCHQAIQREKDSLPSSLCAAEYSSNESRCVQGDTRRRVDCRYRG